LKKVCSLRWAVGSFLFVGGLLDYITGIVNPLRKLVRDCKSGLTSGNKVVCEDTIGVRKIILVDL